jgi:hypothetical protein
MQEKEWPAEWDSNLIRYIPPVKPTRKFQIGKENKQILNKTTSLSIHCEFTKTKTFQPGSIETISR